MNRIFYPYFLWEDWLNGMYATVDRVYREYAAKFKMQMEFDFYYA